MTVKNQRAGVTSLLLTMTVLVTSACSFPNKPVTQAAAVMSKPFSSGEILQVLQTLNNGEIKQAELAMQRTNNPAVRNAAQLIIKDHTASNTRIATMAQTSGVKLDDSPLSTGLRVQANEIAEDLAKLSGPKFDCTYLQKQIEQHDLAVKTVRNQLLPAAKDPQINSLLTTAVPSLEQHKQAAQASRTSLNQC